MFGTPESERLKVTALNLFHPIASPLFQNVGFFHIATQSLNGEGLWGMVSPTEGEEIGIRQNWGKVEKLLPDFERVF